MTDSVPKVQIRRWIFPPENWTPQIVTPNIFGGGRRPRTWLQQSKHDEKAAWCRLCNAPINKPKLSHLEAHMKTVKHQANMGAIKSVKPFSQEFKKKRFEVSFVVVLNVKKTWITNRSANLRRVIKSAKITILSWLPMYKKWSPDCHYCPPAVFPPNFFRATQNQQQ